MPGLPLSPNVRVFWGTRAAPDIDRVLVYTRGALTRADTEAKWSRINQRRPIINELRLRPPRVCIKTRLFVTHLSLRDRPAPVGVRNYLAAADGQYPPTGIVYEGASRTRRFFARTSDARILLKRPPPRSPSSSFPSHGSYTRPCTQSLRLALYTVWVFLRYALYRQSYVLRDDTEARTLSRRKGGTERRGA